ncbi:alpha/beta hydrolase [Paenibacillus donghaensis]|uniref:Alpha/beta hydrolase n=2 Tax=Paenibacillus donghaensis TaxID=414771 RepID=A0A2Z2KR21_9BACL|nr:alpha/beta hydrolase [Paenibacillus donghaensis]ASA26320.1 alpha/beta hydrolase [Paenibacillus donghaensis]
MTRFKRRLYGIKRRMAALTPGWKGACAGIGLTALVLFLFQAYYILEFRSIGEKLLGTALLLAAFLLVSGLLAAMFHLIKKLPTRYVWIALASMLMILFCFIAAMLIGILIWLAVLVVCSGLGALVYRWSAGKYREARFRSRAVALVLALFMLLMGLTGGYWLLSNGSTEQPVGYLLQELKTAERYASDLANPASKGTYKIGKITYGSADGYRKEFNQENSLVTEPVNGSAFVDNWSSLRKSTFGFGSDRMPLNGHVSYPEGDGPFPLVISVHGNHDATDYSDTGYEYLGELLASRGYIFISIDENFLNSSPYDDLMLLNTLEAENPARGWLMLEHLKVWEQWNTSPGNPFYEKVDMNQLALLGHSRGGEAITSAAAFNRMSAYPEDGNIKFDYGFNIRSIISIAGTDGQYKPAGQPTYLKNLNFLALQGAHDMDVSSFSAASQYNRLSFAKDSDFFKSSVYIYGANHGQFNTTWGDKDSIGLNNKLYNIAQLMPPNEQQQVAQVLISAFLDATLKGADEYRAVFADLGYAREWLPNTMYVSNYMDSQTTLLSNYQEDVDPGSSSLPGGEWTGEHLEQWSEQQVEMKYGPELYRAVQLGWDQATAGGGVPAYTLRLPDNQVGAGSDSLIVFDMADQNESGEPALIDMNVALEDTQGHVATVALSKVSYLLPMVTGNLLKFPFTSFTPTKEPVFQSFAIPVSEFVAANPEFDPSEWRSLSFRFELTPAGTVLLREVGIREPVKE